MGGVPNRKMQNEAIAKSIVSVCKTTFTNSTDIPAEDRWYANRGTFWQTYINATLLDDMRTGKFEASLEPLLEGEFPSGKFTAISKALRAKIDMVLGEIRGHGANVTMISALTGIIIDQVRV